MEGIQLNVSFSFPQLVEAIKKLSPNEKLQINEAIWEENMDIPVEHQTIVLERVKKARKDNTRLVNWDSASGKLRK